MTQAVPTNGFIAPPAGGVAPPADAKPGFVPQVPAAGAPDTSATTAPAGTPDLSAAIAALSAVLAAKTPAAQPAGTPATTQAFSAGSDPILQSMAAVLRTSAQGVDLDRLLGKAIEYGDASLIDTAYLQEKGGANSAELLTIAKGMVESVNAKAQAVETAVYALAGSEANWSACTAAFNEKADPALRAVITQMLNSQAEDQIKAAAKLVVDFAKGSGIVPSPAQLLHSGGAAPLTGQALSKDEFQAELRKLNPQDRQYSQLRGNLYARRQAGKNAGK